MASKCFGGHREAKSGFDRTILKPWAVNHCSKRSGGVVCVLNFLISHSFSSETGFTDHALIERDQAQIVEPALMERYRARMVEQALIGGNALINLNIT